jgi:hypothetical protein
MLAVAGTAVDLAGLVRTASAFLSCPVAVMNARGTVLERSAAEAVPSGGSRAILTMLSDREWRDNRYLVRLESKDVLWFGPVPADRRALIRLAGDRIALAAESILQRRVDQRPRGAARASALANLLTGSAEDAIRDGALLGLAVDGSWQVVLASPESDVAVIEQTLQERGELHGAGLIEGLPVTVIGRPGSTGQERQTGRRATDRGVRGIAWLAESAMVQGVAQLPEAYRQARFVAMLISGGAVTPGQRRFDRLGEIGIYRLLYSIWETPALASYIGDVLDPLRVVDKRGILRQTYLAYLDTGGSQSETAAALGIHRNTLTYRLRQIAQLTGHDLNDPNMRLAMHVALVAEKGVGF